MTTAAKKNTHEFADRLHDLGDGVSQIKDDLLLSLKDGVAVAARSGVNEAGRTARRAMDMAKAKGADAADAVKGQVAANPFASIAIAAGVGFVLVPLSAIRREAATPDTPYPTPLRQHGVPRAPLLLACKRPGGTMTPYIVPKVDCPARDRQQAKRCAGAGRVEGGGFATSGQGRLW